jgi:hypothetical protein
MSKKRSSVNEQKAVFCTNSEKIKIKQLSLIVRHFLSLSLLLSLIKLIRYCSELDTEKGLDVPMKSTLRSYLVGSYLVKCTLKLESKSTTILNFNYSIF